MGSLRVKVALINATNKNQFFFGPNFVVKFGHAKYEILKFCPKHGALNEFSADLALSAVTIDVSEPFLLAATKNWCLEKPLVLSPRS